MRRMGQIVMVLAAVVVAGRACFAAAPRPFAVALTDDVQTRGDWLGVYGRYVYILCGTRRPASLKGGPGWPVKFDVETPKKDDPARAWLSDMRTEGDGRVLWHPAGKRRIAASWDDHGEVYPLGTGPNLWINLRVPNGTFMLSLYFFEIDWIQYRRHVLKIFIKRGKQFKLAAKGLVADYFDGVYKRFAVRGPCDARIVIERGPSPNAIVSAVFLDRIGGAEAEMMAHVLPSVGPVQAGYDAKLDAEAAAKLAGALRAKADAGALDAYFRAETRLALSLRAQQKNDAPAYYRQAAQHWQRMCNRARRAAAIAQSARDQITAALLVAECYYGAYDFAGGREALRQAAYVLPVLAEVEQEREECLRRLGILTTWLLDQKRREDVKVPLESFAEACAAWRPRDEAKRTLLGLVRKAILADVGNALLPGLARLTKRYAAAPYDLSLASANINYLGENPDEAIKYFNLALAKMPKGSQRRWTLVALISCHLMAGDDAGAEDVYKRLTREYPKCKERLEAMFRMVKSLAARGKARDAARWLGVLTKEPDAGDYPRMAREYLDARGLAMKSGPK